MSPLGSSAVKEPTPSETPEPGDETIRVSGFSYLPRFITASEAAALGEYFGELHPLWEKRHSDDAPSRRGATGRLTRPVYWLGAWQFAALGYYAEPDHIHHKCVRAEPLPDVMTGILERLRPELALHGDEGPLASTCLINYYGSERHEGRPPVDCARLRMHRDAEPGAVVMFSVGQPAQFEFVDRADDVPVHSQWVRHRSVVVISGPKYKDHLYHRITRVRYGQQPALETKLDAFALRRVSVSFRHVPERYILDLGQLNPEARAVAQPYVEELSKHSDHFRRQLDTVKTGSEPVK
jgi:DNA oxidative demethylase